MDGPPPRFRAGPRRWRWVPLAAGVGIVLLIAITGKLFVYPSPTTTIPKSADAVMVLPGGSGDRLARGLTLMSRKIAPELILPNGATPGWRAANGLCGRVQPYLVRCPTAGDSVRADAELARSLARDSHWGLVVVVTSRYNLTRARLDLDRCLGAGFGMVSSTAHEPVTTKVRHVIDEWVSWLQDGVVHRTC